MPRPHNPNPAIKQQICVPPALDARIRAFLHSEAEQRVPHGALSEFYATLARDFFSKLDEKKEQK